MEKELSAIGQVDLEIPTRKELTIGQGYQNHSWFTCNWLVRQCSEQSLI